mgnify:CR=1 FL=1|tara:strand:+ start:1329 stop:1829 length:501 start_codon:yes stop_codon:yes gene_type:complete
MKGVNGKAKGSRFEREMVKVFSTWTKVPWEKTLGSGAQNTKGDIYPSYDSFPFVVECKHTQTWDFYHLFNDNGPIYDWFNKITEEARSCKRQPLLICKRNHRPVVIMTSSTGYDIFKSAGTLTHNKLELIINKSCNLKYRTGMYVFLLEDLLSIKRSGKVLINYRA